MSHCYVIRAACGCAYGFRVDMGDADTHRSVGAMAAELEGSTIERLPLPLGDAAKPLYKREEHRRGHCPVRDGSQADLFTVPT